MVFVNEPHRIPQVPNLRPLLFITCIQDVVDVISSYKLFFADDLKLFLKIKSLKDRELLQEDINKLISWGTNNWLYLNKVKCFIVSYSKKEHIIINHISECTSEVYKMYGFIFPNCRGFSSVPSLLILFNSLVRSRLEYYALICYPIYTIHFQQLEKPIHHKLMIIKRNYVDLTATD